VVVVDVVVPILMHVMDDLEIPALVSDVVSNCGGAKPSETRPGIDCLCGATGERCYGVPLIEVLENVGPCLRCV
jgi:hypothetical protein